MTACEVCNDPTPSTKKFVYEDGQSVMLGCDRCLGVQSTIHDVYFERPYKSEALGVEFTSKAQKAQYLKDHNLSEAGDMKLGQKNWTDGSRAVRRSGFERDRPILREIQRRYIENRKKG